MFTIIRRTYPRNFARLGENVIGRRHEGIQNLVGMTGWDP